MYKGKLKPSDLNADLVKHTYNQLEQAAKSGYGKDWIKFDPVNSKTVQTMRNNLYRFSGAKTYQQLKEMNAQLIDSKGKIRSFNEFKNAVLKKHKSYNINYLPAEYQTAEKSANMARKWQDFEANKDIYPNLKYKTVGDARVRQDHADLNGIIRPVSHAFWDTYYPPNGWRCRCSVQQTKEAVTKKDIEIPIKSEFKVNVGKTKRIFSERKHPFFAMPKGDKKAVLYNLELGKLTASYGKAKYTANNGARVFVSPFADARDLKGNYRAAIKMTKAKITTYIRPHVDTDILINYTNPEYLIKKKMADRAVPKGLRGILSAIDSKVNKQKCKIVVLDFSYFKNTNRFEIAKKLRGAAKINTKLESLILIFGNEIVVLDRAEIFTSALWNKVIKKATN